MAHSTDSSDRKYNPYKDFNVPLENFYNLPKSSPDYLFEEEATYRGRTMSENIVYYTGSGYAAGSVIGAMKGSVEGLKSAETGDTIKLRISRVLNFGGQSGRRYGNSLGSIGLMFAGLESGMKNYRDTDDMLNSFFAGLCTGAIYRSGSGLRSAAVAGVVGGLAVGIAAVGKQLFKRYEISL